MPNLKRRPKRTPAALRQRARAMLADGYLPRDVLRQLRIRKAALAELLGYHNKSVAAVPVPYATGYRWPRPLDLL